MFRWLALACCALPLLSACADECARGCSTSQFFCISNSSCDPNDSYCKQQNDAQCSASYDSCRRSCEDPCELDCRDTYADCVEHVDDCEPRDASCREATNFSCSERQSSCISACKNGH